ncbi:hypothetical protein [Kaarinaea lacus]
MPDENKLHELKKVKSFGVAPSPFNAIKLELGIVIVVGVLLLIGVDSITQDPLIQMSLLFMAGVLSMVWIIWRTRNVLKSQSKEPPKTNSDKGKA